MRPSESHCWLPRLCSEPPPWRSRRGTRSVSAPVGGGQHQRRGPGSSASVGQVTSISGNEITITSAVKQGRTRVTVVTFDS